MPPLSILRPILDDEALSRILGDAEAQLLFEWLVERAELAAAKAGSAETAARAVGELARRARSIAKFIALWCDAADRGAAGQLASAERFEWPLPPPEIDAWSLTGRILRFEDARAA